MTVNLALPYDSAPSPPRACGISFYSTDSKAFLFDGPHDPQLVCLPHRRAVKLNWALARNGLVTPFRTGSVQPQFDNSFALTFDGTDLEPGFYDVRVHVYSSAAEVSEAATTFGWRIDDMPVHPCAPSDFMPFWKAAAARLEELSPHPKFEWERRLEGDQIGAYNIASAALPEHYDPEGEEHEAVEIYRVRFGSHANTLIEGWFTKPAGPGPFPGLLVLPGAGNNARPAPVEHARHGYATLDIQVHGCPVDAASYSALPGDDPAADISARLHYALYLHALQAARVLRNLPAVDATRLAVLGGSQGGRLTLVVAALDQGFRAAIPAITHFAYVPWLDWVRKCNADKQPGTGGFILRPSPHPPAVSDTYLDVLNFAPLVKCPVLMNAGLTDPVSPPTGVYAAYRALSGTKEIVPLPNTGHDWSPAFDRYAWRWLARTAPAR